MFHEHEIYLFTVIVSSVIKILRAFSDRKIGNQRGASMKSEFIFLAFSRALI